MAVPGFSSLTGPKKVGDLKPVNGAKTPKMSTTSFRLMIFGNKGDPMLVKNDDTLKTFCPEAYAEFGGEESIEELAIGYQESLAHWYMTCDSEHKYEMDDYPLASGRGYIVFTSSGLSKGVTLTDSGAVGTEDIPVAMPKSSYFISGNASARDFKVKDFTVVNGAKTPKISPSSFRLLFFGKKSGEMMLVKENEYLADFCPAAYAKYGAEESIEEFALGYSESDNHWYMSCDSGKEFIMDDYVIKAGEGFEIFCSSGLTKGATITLPAALEAPAVE